MDHFHRVGKDVVLLFESTERSQYGVVDVFYKQDFIEGVLCPLFLGDYHELLVHCFKTLFVIVIKMCGRLPCCFKTFNDRAVDLVLSHSQLLC